MADRESSFRQALRAEPRYCPFCFHDGELERRGHEWCCPACSRCWEAFTRHDLRLLKAAKIDPD